MSWFLGIIERGPVSLIDKYSKLRDNSRAEKIFPNAVYFVGGKVNNTIHYGAVENEFLAAAGIAYKINNDLPRTLSSAEWISLFRKNDPGIGGHYAAMLADENSVTLITDQTGLRDIFLLEQPGRIIFSTRLELLAYFTNLEINFDAFSTSWLCINNLTDQCIYRGISRLTRGKKAHIDTGELKVRTEPAEWFPDDTALSANASHRFTGLLKNLTVFQNKPVNLGLSGGLDSRVLLTMLLSAGGNDSFSTYTIGPDEDKDCRVASEISASLVVGNTRLETRKIDIADNFHDLGRFCFDTRINHPLHSYEIITTIDCFSGSSALIIDGGFGEFWRREFLNRILWRGKRDLISENHVRVLQNLFSIKPEIFLHDIITEMRDSALNQVRQLFRVMPKPTLIGIENWLDLFALKTRLPNYYGPEQCRLDNQFAALMPFAQLPLIRLFSGLALSERKNGSLFKKIIRENSPKLTAFPLVKGNSLLPFNTGTVYGRILGKIKNRVSTSHSDNRFDYLFLFKEPVLDILFSSNVKSVPYYNYRFVRRMVEKFYSRREMSLGSSVEWWLSFEAARQYSSSIERICQ